MKPYWAKPFCPSVDWSHSSNLLQATVLAVAEMALPIVLRHDYDGPLSSFATQVSGLGVARFELLLQVFACLSFLHLSHHQDPNNWRVRDNLLAINGSGYPAFLPWFWVLHVGVGQN